MSKPILIIADSRGRQLEPELSRALKYLDYRLIWKSGLTLHDTGDFAYQTILNMKPWLTYVLTGICDLTVITCKQPWTVALRIANEDALVHRYMTNLDMAFSELYSTHMITGHRTMVIFATQTGIDFKAYNNYPGDLISPHQLFLNNAITRINRHISNLNASMSILTPFLASSVHQYTRHRYRYVYSKLVDGCHPSANLSAIWADKLRDNAYVNIGNYDSFNLVNQMY